MVSFRFVSYNKNIKNYEDEKDYMGNNVCISVFCCLR